MPDVEGEPETEYVEEVEYEDVEEEVEVEEEEEAAQDAGDAGAAVGTAVDLSEKPETASIVDASSAESPAADAAPTNTGSADPTIASAPEQEATADPEPQPAAAVSPAQHDTAVSPAQLESNSSAAAADTAPSASPATQQAAASEYDLKHLEAHAAKVAKDVQAAAAGVQQKFTAGLQSMLGGVGGPNTASASLSKVAGGLSSWWSSLDPMPQPKRDETAELIQGSNKASGELQDVFGLGVDENLVELFKCKLLQTYGCSHNSFTPAIQMAFQGTLYITDKHTCFSVEERGRKLPFKISHASIVKATRQRPARRGDLSDILRLETGAGVWLAFKDFDSGSALDSALALVEHLMEG